jgi:hypothetical protein
LTCIGSNADAFDNTEHEPDVDRFTFAEWQLQEVRHETIQFIMLRTKHCNLLVQLRSGTGRVRTLKRESLRRRTRNIISDSFSRANVYARSILQLIIASSTEQAQGVYLPQINTQHPCPRLLIRKIQGPPPSPVPNIQHILQLLLGNRSPVEFTGEGIPVDGVLEIESVLLGFVVGQIILILFESVEPTAVLVSDIGIGFR